jgi:hypothetical protein
MRKIRIRDEDKIKNRVIIPSLDKNIQQGKISLT